MIADGSYNGVKGILTAWNEKVDVFTSGSMDSHFTYSYSGRELTITNVTDSEKTMELMYIGD